MADKKSEERSHAWGEDSDPRFDIRRSNQLAPNRFDGQQAYQPDHSQQHHINFPSMSPYSMDTHPQYTRSSAAYPYESPHARAYPALYRPSPFANSAVAPPQHSFQPWLPVLTDQRRQQQESPYYGHDHPQQPHQPSSSGATHLSPPTRYNPQPLQHTTSGTAYPPPSAQQVRPTFSNGTNERYTPQSLPDSPEPQDNRSERTAEYQAKLAAVNGVVVPSKRAPGEMPLGPPETRSSGKFPLNYLCSICGAAFAQKYHVQSHFVSCVARNGNPTGAHWNDGLQTPRRRARRTRTTKPNSQTNALAPQLSHSPLTPTSNLSERTKAMHARLDAVNGVVIPSKLAKGELPMGIESHAGADKSLDLFCPLCKSAFGKRDHVRSHFPSCVNRNGNPDGLRWDDGLP